MRVIALLAAAALAAGCYHTEHQVTYVGAQKIHARNGHVMSVREVTRAQTYPPPGTTAGSMLGGIVFHPGGAAVIGNGFGISPPLPGRRTYEIDVAFDDGETGVFVYQDWSPYRPGDRVRLTPEGLILR
jgi:outer membrane lipoprotein SlyB